MNRQAVDRDLRTAQTRALEHLVRSCGARVEALPADIETEFADAFSIWSAMVAAAKQPSFRYCPERNVPRNESLLTCALACASPTSPR